MRLSRQNRTQRVAAWLVIIISVLGMLVTLFWVFGWDLIIMLRFIGYLTLYAVCTVCLACLAWAAEVLGE